MCDVSCVMCCHVSLVTCNLSHVKIYILFLLFSKHWPSGPMLYISWFVHLCAWVSVSLSVCLFTFEVPFTAIFAPITQSQMSKNLRDLASLLKSNGKKWSQIWNFLLIKGVKLPRQFFFLWIFFICSLRLNVFFTPLPEVQCPNFLDFWNPWNWRLVSECSAHTRSEYTLKVKS